MDRKKDLERRFQGLLSENPPRLYCHSLGDGDWSTDLAVWLLVHGQAATAALGLNVAPLTQPTGWEGATGGSGRGRKAHLVGGKLRAGNYCKPNTTTAQTNAGKEGNATLQRFAGLELRQSFFDRSWLYVRCIMYIPNTRRPVCNCAMDTE